MIEPTIEIHEQLITVLKEKFKAEFGVAIEDASESIFSQQKIDFFKHRIFLLGNIMLKDGIKPDSIRKKFKRALIFPEGSIGGVTIGQYDEVCLFLLSKKTGDCSKDYPDGKVVRTVRSLDYSRRIGKQFQKEIPKLDLSGKQEAVEIKIDGVIYFDDAFWDRLKITSTKQQIDLVSRYYTHIDTNQISQAVATERFIVKPQDLFFVIDSEKNGEQKTFTQILGQANSEYFSLIKVLGEGGIGKSTFLYWIGKNYSSNYNIFLLQRIHANSAELMIDACFKVSERNSGPIVFMIDDVAEYGKSQQIVDFINKIKENLTSSFQIVFIVAERKSRYNTQIGQKKLDRHFSGNVQLLEYVPANKKEIFSKVFSILSDNEPQLKDASVRRNAEAIFLDETIYSISESIFRLLVFLKRESYIVYDFDWDDWDKFIEQNSEYSSLENLFIAVTCFYQFGIQMPITFQCTSLIGGNRVQIRKAIASFGSSSSPIRITEDSSGEDSKLFLKHEYVATWFLYDDNRKAVIREFFKDFLSSINTIEGGWLLRQFRKILKTPEYLNSGFGDILDENTYLTLIDQYLQVGTIPQLEKVKMLMEKGIILEKKGEINGAKSVFESIENNSLSKNYAKDRLAKIYLKSPSTYQLAFNKYLEIFENQGLYAIVQLYKILRLSKRYNININYESDDNFVAENIFSIANRLNSYDYHQAIKEFIANKEFELAERLLEKAEPLQNVSAECYNILANSIVYSDENINRKQNLFLKAIEIDGNLNPGEENFQYTIDYAVFLYRTREFPESLQAIKNFTSHTEEELKKHIEDSYWNIVRSTKKLFFKDLPPKENGEALKEYLLKQTLEAASLVSFKQKNIDNIIKGYLILKTVAHHAKYTLPNVYNNALKLMAYCYAQNAEKGWNILPIDENRAIAENLYDQLLNTDYFLDKNDCAYLLKNILNFKKKEKSEKALFLANKILEDSKNQNFSIFYRYRGNAKKYLEDYDGAMSDYQKAVGKCISKYYENEKDHKNDMIYLLNNIALLICDCIELGKPFKAYNLQNASRYCEHAIRLRLGLRKELGPLKETKNRIEHLMKNGDNNDRLNG